MAKSTMMMGHQNAPVMGMVMSKPMKMPKPLMKPRSADHTGTVTFTPTGACLDAVKKIGMQSGAPADHKVGGGLAYQTHYDPRRK